MTEHASDLRKAFGFLFSGELGLFQSIARSLPAGAVFVNIGAGVGTSSLAVVEANQNIRAFTVDISEGGPHGGLENERNAFAPTGLALPTQILGDSKAVGKAWNGPAIDFLFIDGDHSYEGCKGDIDAWYPHIVPDGLIAIHDYERDVWPDVRRATDEAAAKYGWKFITHVETLIVYRVAK